MRGFSRFLCVVSLLFLCAGAYADTFNFTVTGGAGVSGSGSLTAVPDANIAGAFDITSISGTLDGGTITSLLPCPTYNPSSPCTSSSLTFSYDNVLYPSGVSSFYVVDLDDSGIGFVVGSEAVDIAATGSHQETLTYNGEPGDAGPYIVSFNVTPTPEPSSLLLLGSGVVGTAFSMRRRLKGHGRIAIG